MGHAVHTRYHYSDMDVLPLGDQIQDEIDAEDAPSSIFAIDAHECQDWLFNDMGEAFLTSKEIKAFEAGSLSSSDTNNIINRLINAQIHLINKANEVEQ